MKPKPFFEVAAERLAARGAEIIILGCTEIPIGMQKQYKADPARFVDSNEALALSVIEHFLLSKACNQVN